MPCSTMLVKLMNPEKLLTMESSTLKFNAILNFLKFYGKILFVFICLSVSCLFLLPIFIFRPKSVENTRLLARVTTVFTSLVGITYIPRNTEILTKCKAAIVISNHQTALDVFGCAAVLLTDDKLNIHAAVKKETLYLGPFGLAAGLSSTIVIDRNNPKLAHQQMNNSLDIINKWRSKWWIFPEGTRNKGDLSKFLEFKRGAFHVAIDGQLPIIPVVYSPYSFIDHSKHIFGSGSVILSALPAIPTEGLTKNDIPDLINKIKPLMEEEYQRLAKEIEETKQ